MIIRKNKPLYTKSFLNVYNKSFFSNYIDDEDNTDTEVIEGYNIVLRRVANVIICVTDKQPSKILHIYPECMLANYLKNVSSMYHYLNFSLQQLKQLYMNNYYIQCKNFQLVGLSNLTDENGREFRLYLNSTLYMIIFMIYMSICIEITYNHIYIIIIIYLI